MLFHCGPPQIDDKKLNVFLKKVYSLIAVGFLCINVKIRNIGSFFVLGQYLFTAIAIDADVSTENSRVIYSLMGKRTFNNDTGMKH